VTPPWLLPVLVHAQARLDGDLSLAALARVARLSPHHFARAFQRAVGETPKQYTQRLRLERAAVRLALHGGRVVEVALDCGFGSHETFARAFRRRFGITPRAQRARGLARGGQARAARDGRPAASGGFTLSATRIRELRALSLAFVRRLGPYERVGEEAWNELLAWANARRIGPPHVWLGIGHDAPGVTPAARLRFDAALVVERPFAPVGRIGHQVLPAATYAVTTHVGPYESLPRAYPEIFERVARLSRWHNLGVPCVEIYHTTHVRSGLGLAHTDVYVPVARAVAKHAR
jgi:AraC family transcriptional regulator